MGRPLWLPHLYLVDSVFHFLVSSVRCFTFFSSLSVDAFGRPVICRFGYLCVYGVDLRVSRFYVYFSFTRYGLTISCNLCLKASYFDHPKVMLPPWNFEKTLLQCARIYVIINDELRSRREVHENRKIYSERIRKRGGAVRTGGGLSQRIAAGL